MLLPPKSQPLFLTLWKLLRNRRAQDTGPEMHALRALNDLLIDGIGRMVHQHRALPVIELAVHARIADEVDDPFLAFGFVEAQARGEIPAPFDVSFYVQCRRRM